MKFQGNISIKPFTYRHLQEALKLDIDAAVPPLTYDYLDSMFYNSPKVEFIGAWQEAVIDDYVTDAGEEVTVTEQRLVGFAILLPMEEEDSFVEVHHLATHYVADIDVVGKELVDRIKTNKLPIKISVRSRNKSLSSFLRKQGFKLKQTIKGGFRNPTEARIVYYHENN